MRALLLALLVVTWPATAAAQDRSGAMAAVTGGNSDPLDCGPPADDDPTTRQTRFSEHYKRGIELLNMGEYQRAIVEFTAAYCILPAPEPIKAIAQAYTWLVDYENAVLWYELYIIKLPGDDKAQQERENTSHRVAVMRKLPARVRVATDPPGATITLAPDSGATPVEGTANGAEPLAVLAGTYTMTISLAGHEPIEETIVVKIGQPYTFSYRMEPQTGMLRVTVDPPSARIFVDQKLVALGSYVDRLPIGPHTILAEAPGYGSKTEEAIVSADSGAQAFLTLDKPPRSGRRELIAASTLFGLLAGGSISVTFDADFGSGFVYTVVGGAIGFFGAFLGAPERIPEGHTSWIIGSSLWGAIEAAAIADIITDDVDVISALTITGALGGVLAATLSAKTLDLSGGDAALVNSGGMWGAATGLMFVNLFDQEPRLFAPLLLAGTNFGLLAGGALAYRYDYSRGHVALIDLAGLAGAVTGIALSNAVAQGFAGADRSVHMSLGGTILGLVVGSLLTRNMDEATMAKIASVTPTFAVGGDKTVVGISLPW